ncbi:DUF1501 domain-containing protein [Botrimarina hoheduenensis]|uniref:Sulfatase n=1 Tax=Botrimarina hoheduenensis TaxID=2528000 RepID=A0A5C5W7F1_9BACT|nr:DUF1501 domain-containing protein [Botrimarina hoheduenensis]TWT46798.1 hypothetical protein Pla111_19000 [Botrimarina hoheduenensis]
MAPESTYSRRSFLTQSAYGLGGIALAELLGTRLYANPSSRAGATGLLTPPSNAALSAYHHQPRVKRVIHLCMAGGPSHLETYDPKPQLNDLHGKPFPESFTKGQQLAQLQNSKLIARGAFCEFVRSGESGLAVSKLLPHIGSIADEICVVRSMVTDQINHDPAQGFMNSGTILKGRPSMGSWLIYGLGAETDNLPGFVVLLSKTKGGGAQPISARQWSAGFLPSRFQGIELQSRGEAVHYVGNPEGVCQSLQRQVVEEVNRLNRLTAAERIDPELETRIRQYELAFRMQTSVPELSDFSQESPETLKQYGVKEPGDGSFASNCLLARRLAERGVRFIQLYHRGWDHHGKIAELMPISAEETDRASAALVKDLKQRGMLDDTLVIWGGEFGRTPMGQGSGRDHHINAFSLWLAGGGIRGGMTFGATDELGYGVVEDRVTFHDLHATMLHLCGIDHERLTVKFQGLDAKLSGVEPARVVKEILA